MRVKQVYTTQQRRRKTCFVHVIRHLCADPPKYPPIGNLYETSLLEESNMIRMAVFPLIKAICVENHAAIRILVKFGANFDFFKTSHKAVTALTEVCMPDMLTDDVLLAMIESGYDVNMQHFKVGSHLNLVEPAHVFMLAEHGARYDIPSQATMQGVDYNFPTVKARMLQDVLFDEGLRILLVVKIICLIAIGETPHFQQPDKSALQKFDAFLVKYMDRNMVNVITESGYRPQELASDVESGDISAEEVEKFQAMFNRVLSLQRLAANVIRTSLRPNAVAGLKQLPLPVMFDKTFITLGLTQEKSKPGFLSMQHNT